MYDEIWSAQKRFSEISEDEVMSKKLQKMISSNGSGSEAKATENGDHKLLNSLLTKTPPKVPAPIHFTPTLVTGGSNVNTNIHVNGSKSLESLFDGLQGEIDSCVVSVDARKRLAFYMSQIQQAYNEKIMSLVKSRIELQEASNATQLENEALKARIKYLDIENQLLMSGTKGMLGAQPNSAFSALTRHLYQAPTQLYPGSLGLQMSPTGKEAGANSSGSSAATPSKYFAGKGFSLAPFPSQYVNALKCEMMSTQ